MDSSETRRGQVCWYKKEWLLQKGAVGCWLVVLVGLVLVCFGLGFGGCCCGCNPGGSGWDCHQRRLFVGDAGLSRLEASLLDGAILHGLFAGDFATHQTALPMMFIDFFEDAFAGFLKHSEGIQDLFWIPSRYDRDVSVWEWWLSTQDLVDLFMETTFQTEVGQLLDLQTLGEMVLPKPPAVYFSKKTTAKVQKCHLRRFHVQQMGADCEVQDRLLLLLSASRFGHAGGWSQHWRRSPPGPRDEWGECDLISGDMQ